MHAVDAVFITPTMMFACRKVNLMDNMINMLEQYATNLEGLVAQRTKQLAEEKERADRLLYQMLPR